MFLQGRCNADPSLRSVTVMISDVCPECESNHMDIQALTYNKVFPAVILVYASALGLRPLTQHTQSTKHTYFTGMQFPYSKQRANPFQASIPMKSFIYCTYLTCLPCCVLRLQWAVTP